MSQSTSQSQKSSGGLSSFQTSVIRYLVNRIFDYFFGSLRFTLRVISFLLPFIKRTPSYQYWAGDSGAQQEQAAAASGQSSSSSASAAGSGVRQRK